MDAGQSRKYLDRMGIPSWVLRDGQPEPEPEPRPAAIPAVEESVAVSAEPVTEHPVAEESPVDWVIQPGQQPLATVVARWPDQNLSLTPDYPAGQLLVRIIGALGQPLERFRVLGWQDPNQPPDAEGVVFCFCDQAVPGKDWVLLPSLQRMLEEGKAAKGPAWAILQPWIQRLADQ